MTCLVNASGLLPVGGDQGRVGTQLITCANYPLSLAVLREWRKSMAGLCADCLGPKEPGHGRRYCPSCAERRAPVPALCECGKPKAPNALRYCADCQSPEAVLARRRAHDRIRRPSKPCAECGGPKTAGGDNLRCAECRRARPAKPKTKTVPDVSVFPRLPSGPLATAVGALVRSTALDSVYSSLLTTALTGETGEPLPTELVAREGAPSAREAVCERLGIPSRALYNWERRRVTSVKFDVADRVVTRAGWLWWMVWEPCATGCEGIFGPQCPSCHGHELARLAFEGPDED